VLGHVWLSPTAELAASLKRPGQPLLTPASRAASAHSIWPVNVDLVASDGIRNRHGSGRKAGLVNTRQCQSMALSCWEDPGIRSREKSRWSRFPLDILPLACFHQISGRDRFSLPGRTSARQLKSRKTCELTVTRYLSIGLCHFSSLEDLKSPCHTYFWLIHIHIV